MYHLYSMVVQDLNLLPILSLPTFLALLLVAVVLPDYPYCLLPTLHLLEHSLVCYFKAKKTKTKQTDKEGVKAADVKVFSITNIPR